MKNDEDNLLERALEIWPEEGREPEPDLPPHCRPVFPDWKGGLLRTGRGNSFLFGLEISEQASGYLLALFNPGGLLLDSRHIPREVSEANGLDAVLERAAVNDIRNISIPGLFSLLHGVAPGEPWRTGAEAPGTSSFKGHPVKGGQRAKTRQEGSDGGGGGEGPAGGSARARRRVHDRGG